MLKIKARAMARDHVPIYSSHSTTATTGDSVPRIRRIVVFRCFQVDMCYIVH